MPAAELADSVEVGPFSIIGAQVRVGEGTTIGAHCVIEGPTTIGRDNRISPYCVARRRAAGQEVRRRADRAGDRRPQHDPRVLHLQPRHRAGRRRDAPGQRQLDHGLCAHRARLSGRQPDDDGQLRPRWPAMCTWATGSSSAAIPACTSSCKVGAHAMIGFSSAVSQDVPPFMTVDGNPLAVRGFNVEGLRRRGFDAERIAAVKQMHRLLYRQRPELRAGPRGDRRAGGRGAGGGGGRRADARLPGRRSRAASCADRDARGSRCRTALRRWWLARPRAICWRRCSCPR